MLKLTPNQKKAVNTIGRKFNLKFIILHGSCVTGRTHQDSDLDIAFVGKKETFSKDLSKIYFALEDVFAADNRELDVKSLDRADPLFLYQVIKNSQLLYGDRTAFNGFRAYAFSFYHDSYGLFELERKLVDKSQKYLTANYA